MRIVSAREAAHPTTSSGTGLKRRQDYCVVYLSARNLALVTTWKDWGGHSRRGWTQEARRDAKNLGCAIYARPSTLREVLRREHCLSGTRRARAPTSRKQTATIGTMAMDLQADNGSDAKHRWMERAKGALLAEVRSHYRPPEEH